MVMTTESMMKKPINKTKDEPGPRKYPAPVLPAETPARIQIRQKYKKGLDGMVVPEEHVTIIYNYVGRGKGGSFKVPRATMDTFWKAMQS